MFAANEVIMSLLPQIIDSGQFQDTSSAAGVRGEAANDLEKLDYLIGLVRREASGLQAVRQGAALRHLEGVQRNLRQGEVNRHALVAAAVLLTASVAEQPRVIEITLRVIKQLPGLYSGSDLETYFWTTIQQDAEAREAFLKHTKDGLGEGIVGITLADLRIARAYMKNHGKRPFTEDFCAMMSMCPPNIDISDRVLDHWNETGRILTSGLEHDLRTRDRAEAGAHAAAPAIPRHLEGAWVTVLSVLDLSNNFGEEASARSVFDLVQRDAGQRELLQALIGTAQNVDEGARGAVLRYLARLSQGQGSPRQAMELPGVRADERLAVLRAIEESRVYTTFGRDATPQTVMEALQDPEHRASFREALNSDAIQMRRDAKQVILRYLDGLDQGQQAHAGPGAAWSPPQALLGSLADYQDDPLASVVTHRRRAAQAARFAQFARRRDAAAARPADAEREVDAAANDSDKFWCRVSYVISIGMLALAALMIAECIMLQLTPMQWVINITFIVPTVILALRCLSTIPGHTRLRAKQNDALRFGGMLTAHGFIQTGLVTILIASICAVCAGTTAAVWLALFIPLGLLFMVVGAFFFCLTKN